MDMPQWKPVYLPQIIANNCENKHQISIQDSAHTQCLPVSVHFISTHGWEPSFQAPREWRAQTMNPSLPSVQTGWGSQEWGEAYLKWSETQNTILSYTRVRLLPELPQSTGTVIPKCQAVPYASYPSGFKKKKKHFRAQKKKSSCSNNLTSVLGSEINAHQASREAQTQGTVRVSGLGADLQGHRWSDTLHPRATHLHRAPCLLHISVSGCSPSFRAVGGTECSRPSSETPSPTPGLLTWGPHSKLSAPVNSWAHNWALACRPTGDSEAWAGCGPAAWWGAELPAGDLRPPGGGRRRKALEADRWRSPSPRPPTPPHPTPTLASPWRERRSHQ